MIRGKADFYEKLWAGLELLSALLLVAAGWLIGPLIPGQPILGRGIGIVLGFLAGWLLPSLIFGLPVFELRWRIDDTETKGAASVDIRARVLDKTISADDFEFYFKVVLRAKYSSFAGWRLLKKAKRRGVQVVVQFRPIGVTSVKAQRPIEGSVLEQGDTAPTIRLDVVDTDHETEQTQFVGSFVPGLNRSSTDSIDIRADILDPKTGKSFRWARVEVGTTNITIRK
ncbi:hypothetical protein [Clavibacter zhangzhiyongii]|uniref:hypothetical protein n=1 Tax=Clavibacter zhangzhiyongii TaxID=2768071 RepID=UPI0039E0B49F